mmetsp:Transcript_27085/g.35131  ORF Transcript_27085/g.35131 Transcript_27085/m.35131 type:complete len:227 (-) Transcript_27085:91-771(-)
MEMQKLETENEAIGPNHLPIIIDDCIKCYFKTKWKHGDDIVMLLELITLYDGYLDKAEQEIKWRTEYCDALIEEKDEVLMRKMEPYYNIYLMINWAASMFGLTKDVYRSTILRKLNMKGVYRCTRTNMKGGISVLKRCDGDQLLKLKKLIGEFAGLQHGSVWNNFKTLKSTECFKVGKSHRRYFGTYLNAGLGHRAKTKTFTGVDCTCRLCFNKVQTTPSENMCSE